MAYTDAQTKDFIRLVTEYQPEMFYFILSLVPHRLDAEEILQDTHLFLWQRFGEFQPGTDFRAWAFQIAYYRVLKFFDREQRSRKLFSDDFLAHQAKSAIQLPPRSNAQQEALSDCINKLTPKDRSLLDARYRPGATVIEVAKEFGRNVDGVYRALRRIYHALFECVQLKLIKEDDS